MVEAAVCLRGTANKIISGKDYYAMLHTHTMVYAATFAPFKDGNFTVRQTEGRFNGVCTDMAQTYNRNAKTKLFTGISQQPAAMEKYLKALPVLTAVSEQTKAMAHLDVNDQTP